jgi:hypothetical protein
MSQLFLISLSWGDKFRYAAKQNKIKYTSFQNKRLVI